MIYLLKKDIPDKKYNRFERYLFSRCDVAAFNIPYFSWKVGEPKPECFDDEFTEYIEENMQDLLDEIKPFIIGDYFSNVYFETKKPYMMRIIIFELNEETEFVLPSMSIYTTEYPESFEDLCLFSKGTCFLKYVSGEKMCLINTLNQFDAWYLKKLGAKLKLISDDDDDVICTLEYRVCLNNEQSNVEF